jgi:hypothetical protein
MDPRHANRKNDWGVNRIAPLLHQYVPRIKRTLRAFIKARCAGTCPPANELLIEGRDNLRNNLPCGNESPKNGWRNSLRVKGLVLPPLVLVNPKVMRCQDG